MAGKRAATDWTDEVCPEHFPDGVPPGSTSVGCEHGMWSGDETAVPEPTEQPYTAEQVAEWDAAVAAHEASLAPPKV